MVSGTRERTIASWAALALVVGLSLSAAPAAHSATETATGDPGNETSQISLDESVEMAEPGATQGDDEIGTPDLGDETPTESTTPTPTESTTPTPTTPPGSPEPDPSESTNGQDDGGNGQDSTGAEEPSPPNFSCTGGGFVTPGEKVDVPCQVPENFQLTIPSDGSHGGTAVPNVTEITYTAPATFDGAGQEVITVHAVGPGDELLITDVTFSFDGPPNGDGSDEQNGGEETEEGTDGDDNDEQNGGGDTEQGNGDSEGTTEDSPPPPDSQDPATPSPETDTPTATGADTDPPAKPEPTDVTSAAQTPDLPQLPGAPGDPSIEPSQSLIPHLPVPGMPDPGSESISPGPTADASDGSADGTDDGAGEDEPEDDEGGLAQTGPEQVAWSGSLAASAIVLGITALALSRRQHQRSLGP